MLIDAINAITGDTELYTTPPEPFTYIPRDHRRSPWRRQHTSPYPAALFGRSARATGMENERDNKPVPAQWLYLPQFEPNQRKLEQGRNLAGLFSSRGRPREIVEELYLTILSRQPTADEMRMALEHVGSGGQAGGNASGARSGSILLGP